MASRKKKKRRNIPYTNFSKKLFRSHGYMVDDTERLNCWSGNKNDLFGFGDLLGVRPYKPPVIIQSTSYSNHKARVRKILGERKRQAKICLQAGFRIAVCSWRKTNNRWVPRVQEITIENFS